MEEGSGWRKGKVAGGVGVRVEWGSEWSRGQGGWWGRGQGGVGVRVE